MTAESFTVAWWPVHRYASELADRLGVSLTDRIPYPGTLGWLSLADDDPVKKAGLLLAGSHEILTLEIVQETKAEASKSIANSSNWPSIALELRQLADWRASRPWARREVEQHG